MNSHKIAISKSLLESVLNSRKMTFDHIQDVLTDTELAYFDEFAQMESLANYLAVPIAYLLRGYTASDLDDGVKIARSETSFRRDEFREGIHCYTYSHLVTTNQDPHLMALRVDVHSNQKQPLRLNSGHSCKEVVYVTKGSVQVRWLDSSGQLNASNLSCGDSIFISPGVPHSFNNTEEGSTSEMIAFNYNS